MLVLQLRRRGRESTWATVSANSKARRLLGSNFGKNPRLPVLRTGRSAEHSIDVDAALRATVDSRRPALLGHVTELSAFQSLAIYAVHALPLDRNCVAIVLRDVNQDAKARRDKKAAAARLDQICRAARAIQWSADPDTLEFTSVTSEAQAILGYWTERWLSESDFWRNHAHPDDREALRSQCLEAARAGNAGPSECRMLDIEGRIHWFNVRVTMESALNNRAELSGVMVDITEQKQTSQAARELSAQVTRAQEHERKRISRDLHDSVGQNLTGLHWSLARIGRQQSVGGKLKVDLKECEHMVQVCIEEVRAVSQGLYPPALEMLGLAPVVEWQAKRFAEQSGLQIRLEMPERMERMEPDREITLFRVFQECLSNVRRHSNSDAAAVRLRQESGAVILEVEDRGVGAPADLIDRLERGRRGVGLLKMRERLVELGGTLEIIPCSPGTLVRARLPDPKKSERSRNDSGATPDVASAQSRRS
jgi:PAS domain S-box-containing protein